MVDLAGCLQNAMQLMSKLLDEEVFAVVTAAPNLQCRIEALLH